MSKQRDINWFSAQVNRRLGAPDVNFGNDYYEFDWWRGAHYHYELRVYTCRFSLEDKYDLQVIAAYSGEHIVFTDESDVRAVELLKRISAERETNGLYVR